MRLINNYPIIQLTLLYSLLGKMTSESGVNLIKKKVATLKAELDESQNRANEAEEQLTEKESIIEKVWTIILDRQTFLQFVPF